MPDTERGVLITTDVVAMQYFLKLDKEERNPFVLHLIDDTHVLVKAERVQYLQDKLDELLESNTFEPTARLK